jgi:MFS family permease
MTNVGMLIGGLACGFFADSLGRRAGFAIACIISIAGVAIEYIASDPATLLGGKIVSALVTHPVVTKGELTFNSSTV